MKEKVSYRPITEQDRDFLYRIYTGTREKEMTLTGWSDEQKEEFLRMQFNLQHTQYLQNYREGSFEIILVDETPAGRLYLNRGKEEIRIIDLELLADFRNRGIGSEIMNDLITEANKKNLPLTLHVLHDNPAFKFYERLGFKIKEDKGMYLLIEKQPGKP
ncbi:MAG: GNAT family N-acetyltransferase [Candidatus Aminicenantes bacterium]|nr:GNAT family N-acetyltransferase [Candidatus Aminicenantes bacterium]